MITLLTGENDFEIARALRALEASFDGTSERFEGADLDVRQLPDMFAGATLFADKRLVIIDALSAHKSVWNALPDWLPRIADDVHVVLVEQKPDKRTKTYKELQKQATHQSFALWTDRDTGAAERWVMAEAAAQGITLDHATARHLVDRIGVGQWELFHALEKLAVFEVVDRALVDRVIEASVSENVFNVLDAALDGDRARVMRMVAIVRQTEDPYMVMGLLSSQLMQLAALVTAGPQMSSAEVAQAIGAHPFALSKLSARSREVSRSQLKRWLACFARADHQLKSSALDPWVVIEQALVGV